MKFVIKGRLDGANEYIKSCRTNHHQANNQKRMNEYKAIQALYKAKGEKPNKYPCELIIAWYEPNRRRDVDNIQFGVKFIQDALVSFGVIPDDSQKFIRAVSHKVFIDKVNPRVEVELKEIEE